MFDNIYVLFYLDAASIYFKCLVVIILSYCIKKNYFLCIIPSSASLSLQRFWLLCLIMSHSKSCFLLTELIQNWFCNLLWSLSCWLIVCTNMNYKVMSVFPERRFDVVLDTFNPHTGKMFHIHLTIFQRMWEIISSNMFDNAVSLDYHFLCLLWYVTFPPNCVGTIVTRFYQQLNLLGLILKSCTWIITTLIFFYWFY